MRVKYPQASSAMVNDNCQASGSKLFKNLIIIIMFTSVLYVCSFKTSNFFFKFYQNQPLATAKKFAWTAEILPNKTLRYEHLH